MSEWYYSDYERNRHGPVTAQDLADLHHAGQLQADTLVWRAGMPQWRAWGEVMTQALDEAAGRTAPAVESAPLSAGVNPYAMAEPAAAPAAAAVAAAPTLASGTNPYAIAEPSSPYAPPRAALQNPSDYVGGGEVVYAGFLKRFAAIFIDGFAIGVVTWIVQIIVMAGFFGVSAGFAGDPGSLLAGAGMIGFMVGMVLVPIALQAVYYAWMHSSSRQATLGKMAVGIKVTDEDGQRISFARGIGRYFATFVSSIILCIGYVMAAFTDRKRALHDMLASTLVVDQWAFTANSERQNPQLGTVTTVIVAIAGFLIIGYIVLIGVLIAMGIAAGAG